MCIWDWAITETFKALLFCSAWPGGSIRSHGTCSWLCSFCTRASGVSLLCTCSNTHHTVSENGFTSLNWLTCNWFDSSEPDFVLGAERCAPVCVFGVRCPSWVPLNSNLGKIFLAPCAVSKFQAVDYSEIAPWKLSLLPQTNRDVPSASLPRAGSTHPLHSLLLRRGSSMMEACRSCCCSWDLLCTSWQSSWDTEDGGGGWLCPLSCPLNLTLAAIIPILILEAICSTLSNLLPSGWFPLKLQRVASTEKLLVFWGSCSSS